MLATAKRKLKRTIARLRPSPSERAKVFSVGWLKTGTTSFGHAMRRLGYRHCGYGPDLLAWFRADRTDRLLRYARHFESFDDLPWNRVRLLGALDQAFPGSRFVLLERDPEDWLRSYLGHVEKRGAPPADPEKGRSVYENHNRQVREHFAGRDDLLIMRVTEGESYGKLCPFLGLPVLDEPFPHANRSSR